jgi:hypothetical protein
MRVKTLAMHGGIAMRHLGLPYDRFVTTLRSVSSRGVMTVIRFHLLLSDRLPWREFCYSNACS